MHCASEVLTTRHLRWYSPDQHVHDRQPLRQTPIGGLAVLANADVEHVHVVRTERTAQLEPLHDRP